mmetsp:Transcript_53189/g.88179  ORF Transcript_53189/g.88179 Transcript_53189/m.88179 type:complete len:201 (-) Transcript_53189:53-655(-)
MLDQIDGKLGGERVRGEDVGIQDPGAVLDRQPGIESLGHDRDTEANGGLLHREYLGDVVIAESCVDEGLAVFEEVLELIFLCGKADFHHILNSDLHWQSTAVFVDELEGVLGHIFVDTLPVELIREQYISKIAALACKINASRMIFFLLRSNHEYNIGESGVQDVLSDIGFMCCSAAAVSALLHFESDAFDGWLDAHVIN